MHILVTAATHQEVKMLVTFLENNFTKKQNNVFISTNLTVSVLITGIGSAATTYTLCNHLQNHNYDCILQLGIAGAFNKQLQIGEVLMVTEEYWGDLGAEDHNDFLDIFDLQLADANEFPYLNKALKNENYTTYFSALKKVKGLTVNCSSGSQDTIDKRIRKYTCDVESMEGAAFHYICLSNNIPFVQLRAISNYVTPRNKNDWNIPLAIENVNQSCIHFLNTQM